MGADHEQILTVVNSAMNARTSGDIMTLTAGAATALRGAATLRARLGKGTTFALGEEKGEGGNELHVSKALNFIATGEETLKRTRKGVIFGVHSDIPAWTKREVEGNSEQRGYFGIETGDRITEVEYESNGDKQMWIDGIQYMLNCRNNIAYF
ncbi:Glyoxalase/Bleomycin resistance protein/Dioxygenase superfamily protein isoform 1 [Hibiscus syriacus]|uniref:Glyoxalase/Bleomycin resistance protein/Dioxygenase superfamily protein isoform 1 n=1 Tax=Hibiscus syriacus TaxID=106335 RepID=A0A6A3C4K7_HIBSY|nr:Glyoxalase/Bleomycin resistance protein/Dioxygenase superfamily protein isoform 1 [Hibiscus syriacus]